LKVLEHKIENGEFSQKYANFEVRAKVVKEKHESFKVDFSLVCKANKLTFVKEIELGQMDSSDGLFINNYQSWGPCVLTDYDEAFKRAQKANSGFISSPIPWEFKSGVVSDYFVATGKEFAGFISSKVAHPYFLIRDEKIEVKAYAGKELKPGEKVELGTMWFTEYESLEETLNEYAKMLAKENKSRTGKPIFGWSSWYHYYLDISEKDFVEEIERSKELKMNYELFQLDDGYELDIGDWLKTNEKFPSGLEFIAQKVKENGMIAGIWTAPFSVSESSELFKNHPEWVVKDENGNPKVAYENWNRKIYALDTTNPDALEWLKGVFNTFKNYGFDFFKIDFLFSAMIPGKRHLNVTLVEAYRKGMEIVRMAVEDSHILGCGAPLLPSIGYVDSMRIGEDTAPYWKRSDYDQISLKFSLTNALTRNFMNGVLWTNDPDCVMVRSKETQLRQEEISLNAYLLALLNGHFLQSDKLSVLSKEDVSLLKSALNFKGGRSSVKFVEKERYVILSKNTINGDVLSFVNLSDRLWNVKIKDFSNLLSEKKEEFFVSYPFIRETNPLDTQNVKPHSILMILHRGKRNVVREDEKKEDGRSFRYYTTQE
jgi:alpha-galactosidase